MKLWKRTLSALKDQKSLLAAKATRFTRRGSEPQLESAIIRATGHDDSYVDYRNAHRVYKLIRDSPFLTFRSFLHFLSYRVQRTRSWIVSLKSLMLVHGVICLKLPIIEEIRCLPFDLSCFSDGHSPPCKVWGFNSFVRAYFAYLDQYSSFLSYQLRYRRENRRRLKDEEEPTIEQLSRIQNLQSLLDLLLQIRPMADNMKITLILEAMDCVVIEIFDIYGRIRDAITNIIVNINPATARSEASTTLNIIQKAAAQGEDLSLYFKICQEFGISNAHDIPKLVKIPEEYIKTIENIINAEEITPNEEEREEEKAIILIEQKDELKTIITEDWEVFDDTSDPYQEKMKIDERCIKQDLKQENQNLPLVLIDQPHPIHPREIPDLITF